MIFRHRHKVIINGRNSNPVEIISGKRVIFYRKTHWKRVGLARNYLERNENIENNEEEGWDILKISPEDAERIINIFEAAHPLQYIGLPLHKMFYIAYKVKDPHTFSLLPPEPMVHPTHPEIGKVLRFCIFFKNFNKEIFGTVFYLSDEVLKNPEHVICGENPLSFLYASVWYLLSSPPPELSKRKNLVEKEINKPENLRNSFLDIKEINPPLVRNPRIIRNEMASFLFSLLIGTGIDFLPTLLSLGIDGTLENIRKEFPVVDALGKFLIKKQQRRKNGRKTTAKG